MNKKKILVLCGGISKERKISLETGKEVTKELKKIDIKLPFVSLTINYQRI